MSLDPRLLDALKAALPAGSLLLSESDRLAYGSDNSRREGMPDAVALPTKLEEVVAVVRACRATRTPLIARGRGTNTTGATVPIAGGVVVSFERMDRIKEIAPDDRLAVVEPGVTNGDLQRAVAEHGFFWAPDPTSADYATVGGNLACNAGGPRAVKYGACRDNVLGLVAVTGAGEVIRTGSRTTKGAVGYDLTRLLVGSEGTLALIVEATLKLTPLPTARRTLRASFRSVAAAAHAVAQVMTQPATPAALEFMDGRAVALVMARGVSLPAGTAALLLIEADGDPDAIAATVEAIARAATVEGLIALERAEDEAAIAALWSARKALSPALRDIAPIKINEDVVVPVSKLPALIDGLAALSAESGIPIVNFGHAGNGNLHVNLMVDPADPRKTAAAPETLARVFDLVIALGGTISGEHGIGLAKRDFMRRAIDPTTLALMRAIRRDFDPDGILNPGKLLPD